MNLTSAQLDELEKNAPPAWIGDAFDVNLKDLIFFAREGLKVAGEEAVLEQIDVLEDSWTRSLKSLKTICNDIESAGYHQIPIQHVESIYWEDFVEAEEREILEMMLASSPISVEVVCTGSQSVPETTQGHVSLALKRIVPEYY